MTSSLLITHLFWVPPRLALSTVMHEKAVFEVDLAEQYLDSNRLLFKFVLKRVWGGKDLKRAYSSDSGGWSQI